MLKLTSFSPMAVIMSERQVEDAALRDDAVDGWGTGQFLVNYHTNITRSNAHFLLNTSLTNQTKPCDKIL